MPIRAVLFDLDGTLWSMGGFAANRDFDWSVITAIRAAGIQPHLNRLNFDVDPSSFVTRLFAEVNATLSPPTPDYSEPSWYPVLERVLGELGHRCERSDATVILDTLNSVPFREFGISAFPDAAPTLEALKNSGLKIGAVTNNPKPPYLLAAEIRRQGLPNVFDTVVSSWELGWRKPHHLLFQTALNNLGVTAEEAAHVGDSLQNDIEPALALGMTAVFRSPTPTQSPPPKAAYHTITSLLELPPLLGLTTP